MLPMQAQFASIYKAALFVDKRAAGIEQEANFPVN